MFGNVDKFCLNVGWSPAGRLFRLRQVEKNSIVGDERDWIILNCFQHFFPLQCYPLSIVIYGGWRRLDHSELFSTFFLTSMLSIINCHCGGWRRPDHSEYCSTKFSILMLSLIKCHSHHNKLSIVEELKVVISINISAQVSN